MIALILQTRAWRGSERLSQLPKDTQLESVRGRNQIWVFKTSEPNL